MSLYFAGFDHELCCGLWGCVVVLDLREVVCWFLSGVKFVYVNCWVGIRI